MDALETVRERRRDNGSLAQLRLSTPNSRSAQRGQKKTTSSSPSSSRSTRWPSQPGSRSASTRPHSSHLSPAMQRSLVDSRPNGYWRFRTTPPWTTRRSRSEVIQLARDQLSSLVLSARVVGFGRLKPSLSELAVLVAEPDSVRRSATVQHFCPPVRGSRPAVCRESAFELCARCRDATSSLAGCATVYPGRGILASRRQPAAAG